MLQDVSRSHFRAGWIGKAKEKLCWRRVAGNSDIIKMPEYIRPLQKSKSWASKICLVTRMILSDTSTEKSLSSNSESNHHHHHSESAHPHVHNEESLRRLVNRLSRIEGHIRGIKTMVQENRPCPEVLVQVAAVRGALDRVARIILDEHLTECIARAAKEGNIDSEIKELKAALDRFLP